MIGAEEVIGLPSGEAGLLERLADVTEPETPARVIGVLAGRGGAGASVLAAGIALAAAARGPAWLLDVDPLGGGADTGLGAELSAGARWADLGVLTGRLSPQALRAAVPKVNGVAVLAADGRSTAELPSDTVRAVVSASGRGAGTVVLDLGRHRTGARDEAIRTADDLLVVVPAELRAVLATRRVLESLGATATRPRVVVRVVPGALPVGRSSAGWGCRWPASCRTNGPSARPFRSATPAALVRGTDLAELCESVLEAAPTVRRAAA